MNDKQKDESSFEIGAEVAAGSATRLREHRNPLSIALLFYVVTVGGIISACLRTLVASQVATQESLVRLLTGGAVLGFMGGACLGFFYFRSKRAGAIASSLGIGMGVVAGALALVEAKNFSEILLLGFAGSWLLIVVMLLSARFQSAIDG